jgi:DNA-nicking Smr family endonuclease
MKARTLGELGAIRQALADARRAAADAAQRERERAAREGRERNLFALTVGAVVPLHTTAVAPARPRPPAAAARQRERDEAAVMHEAISDEFDAESLLDTDDTLSYRRAGIGPEVVRKLRRGVWAIQAQLDLHGLRRDEARERLTGFVHEARRRGLRCVRVIHGKGNGSPGREPVLKSKVKAWLVQKQDVIAFTQARASDGGGGALLVLLGPAAPKATTRDPAPKATARDHPAPKAAPHRSAVKPAP